MEKTLKKTYEIRDKQLDGQLYEDYLKSDRWAQIKKFLFRKPKNRFCKKCMSRGKLNFHHLTYKHLNTKNDTKDIMVFCEKCHNKIHIISRKYDISVHQATLDFLKPKKSEQKEKAITLDKILTKSEEIHQANNQKLLDGLKKYKDYFSKNNSKPRSRKRKYKNK